MHSQKTNIPPNRVITQQGLLLYWPNACVSALNTCKKQKGGKHTAIK
jgi:hypothetical protein